MLLEFIEMAKNLVKMSENALNSALFRADGSYRFYSFSIYFKLNNLIKYSIFFFVKQMHATVLFFIPLDRKSEKLIICRNIFLI